MCMYAVATAPLIDELEGVASVSQYWFADDASALGDIEQIQTWWDGINAVGKHYGYFPNAVKSVLLVKEEFYEKACSCFDGSDISVRTDGVRLLGSPIGSPSTRGCMIWMFFAHLLSLSPRLHVLPLPMGFLVAGPIFFRSCSVPSEHLCALDEMICCKLIPALSGKHAINDLERS